MRVRVSSLYDIEFDFEFDFDSEIDYDSLSV